MSFLRGWSATPYGRIDGSNTLSLMGEAAQAALASAGLERGEIDGLLCGYSTTLPHLMLSTLFAEYFGLAPSYAHGVQVGGATGAAMILLAHNLIENNAARNILLVAGENRLTGQSRDSSVSTLAQVGHPDFEVPLGPTVPSYYALVASQYMARFGVTEEDLAEFPALMRANASRNPHAHLRSPITVADVLASRPISTPLKLLDCCPISDGAAALVVSRFPQEAAAIRIRGGGQAHLHQHVTELRDISAVGADLSVCRAEAASGMSRKNAEYLAIYDSFSITLLLLLEELGFAARGEASRLVRHGYFSPDGARPLNTHGGLMSYGHCGTAGALAHIVEMCGQMSGSRADRQIRPPATAIMHGDGGVLSSHVTIFFAREN